MTEQVTQQRRDALSAAKRALIEQRLRGKPVGSKSGLIPKRAGDGPSALSFAQQRMWFLHQLDPESSAYYITGAVRIEGSLDVEALRRAVEVVVSRHESLRTVFRFENDEPVQIVLPRMRVDLPLEDLSTVPESDRQRTIGEHARREFGKALDLEHGPLIRLKLLRLSAREHILLVSIHHIISDGWSIGVLLGELCETHNASVEGREAKLDDLSVQYADYAAWHRGWLQGDNLRRQIEYWQQQLEDLTPLSLATDKPRPSVPTFRGARHSFSVEPGVVSKLRAMAKEREATLFMALAAGFSALMGRYTAQEEIVLGAAIAGRSRSELEPLIGFFVNSLVLRVDASGDPSFGELVGRVREVSLDAYANQDLPFEHVVEHLQPDRDLTRNPMFQVMMALQNAPMPSLGSSGLTLSAYEVEAAGSPLDIDLRLWESRTGGLEGKLTYNTDLFEASTIARIVEHFKRLLAFVAANPDRPVSEAPLLTDDERELVLHTWNKTEHPLDGVALVHEQVSAAAARGGANPAVMTEGGMWTFAELEARSNRIAHELIACGVKRGDVVAVCLPRGAHLPVSVLGVLKSGAAYAALDPTHPAARLTRMINDSGAKVVLTLASIRGRVRAEGLRVICLDTEEEALARRPATPTGVRSAMSDRAYIIFTSGSTGEPKGVELTHEGLANLVAWHNREYRLGPGDRTTLLAGVGFDASVWEMWPAMCAGAALHVVDEETLGDTDALWAFLVKHAITVAFVPTPVAEAMLREGVPGGLSLRAMLVGGDRLHAAPDRPLPFDLVNHYGPTESTVVATRGVVRGGRAGGPPIGRPIDNVRAYVVDRAGTACPVGVPGELWIAGRSLASGYVGRPDLTRDRFTDAPGVGEKRVYRTGDLVRWLPQGELEFLGRTDQQVKVRGYRIELGEVESALERAPGVRSGVVTAHQVSQGDRRLVAYVVPRASSGIESDDKGGAEWSSDHVDQWQTLYDQTYSQKDEQADDITNLIGWNSSYDGEPIPRREMVEWVEETVARIKTLRPKRVLEIGFGTGLLLFRVAPGTERYVATDFSRVAVAQVGEKIRRLPGYGHVEVRRQLADDRTGIEPGAFDLVIINSVIQYFPSEAYLRLVLSIASEALAPGGRVFAGDIRHLPTLTAFKSSIQLSRAERTTPSSAVRDRVLQAVEEEEELVIDPALFESLRDDIPRLSGVETLVKHARYENELSRFRYDAILHMDAVRSRDVDRNLDWSGDRLDVGVVERVLSTDAPESLMVSGVPNRRIADAIAGATRLSDDDCPATAGELAAEARGARASAADPHELREMAARHGYTLELGLPEEHSSDRFDALFIRGALDRGVAGRGMTLIPRPPMRRSRRIRSMTNNPLRGRVVTSLVPTLREHLAATLPDYMVPSTFIIMDSFPLTRSGKVNRRALPSPQRLGGLSHMAPLTTETERRLGAIWCELLNIEAVGADDNFFELGGHSLLATRLVSRLRREFGVSVSLRHVFDTPTIAGLAERIDTLSIASAATSAIGGDDEDRKEFEI